MKKRKIINNWLSYAPRASADDVPTIYIFEQIGKDWWSEEGVSARDFQQALQEIGPTAELIVEINSPGGNVWDGLSIYNMLRGHGAKVTTRVTGLAASIASIIALAGNTVEMSESALFMIHKASGLQAGNADEMRKMAEMLDKHDEVLAGIYAAKTGKTTAKITEMMAAETWFSGPEAKAGGFIDTIVNLPAAQASFDLSRFRRVPAASATHTTAHSSAPNSTDMNRQTILALLKKRGVSVPENATDEQIIALLDTSTSAPQPAPAPAPAATATPQPAQGLTAEAIAAAVVSALKLSTPAPAARIDPGVEPVANIPRTENNGNPLLEERKKFKPGAARNRFLVENHAELLRQSQIHAPQNANTFTSTLVVDYLADAVITVATAKLAMVGSFTRNVGLDNLRPRAVVRVKKFTTGDDAVDNATNFEDGAANQSTLAGTSVTVNQITKTFTVTQGELNQGFALSDLSQGSAEIFALAISKKITAVMTAALYGAGTVIGTAANFDSSDIPAILALAKNYREKLLLLDGGHMARLMFSGQLTAAAGTNPFPDSRYGPLNNGFFGFQNILEQNDWTGAIANTAGFVCGKDAIAVASGLPVGMIPGEFLEQRSIELSNGLSVLLSVWYSRSSRAHMASYDIMFGVAAADTTQAEVLITA